MATAKCIRAPAVGGSGRGFVSSQRLALVFLVAVDDVAADLGRADLERGGVFVVLDVATVEVETVAEPPCLTCTLPPTRERELTETWRAFSPWTLPIPRTPRAISVAPRSTLIVSCTCEPCSSQCAPSGTRSLSTVIAPSVPRQLRSSASAVDGRAATVASAAAPARVMVTSWVGGLAGGKPTVGVTTP